MATRDTKIPSIGSVPDGLNEDLTSFLSAIKERLEIREGNRANILDKTLLRSDLRRIGIDVDALKSETPFYNLAETTGVPIGCIIPWIGGYFTDGSNAGYTRVLATDNTVAAVNALLNSDGWYVCNGAALNVSGSPIFSAANRYLPNLTDDRFLMGDTAVGGIGGSSTMAHTHSVTSNVAVGNHSNHVFTQPSAHVITQPTFTGPSHDHGGVTGASDNNQAIMETGTIPSPVITHSHAISGDGTGACTRSGNVGLSNNHSGGGVNAHSAHSVTNNAVTSGPASETENRPKYLGCFYIMKVC